MAKLPLGLQTIIVNNKGEYKYHFNTHKIGNKMIKNNPKLVLRKPVSRGKEKILNVITKLGGIEKDVKSFS